MNVKERILKQTLKKMKNGNHVPTVMLSMNGIQKRYDVSRIVYCSFNNILFNEYTTKKIEICHLDKNSSNNILSNLSLEKKWFSKYLIYVNKGLSEAQKAQYQKRIDDYDKIESRVCKICSTKKPMQEYYRGHKECKDCTRERNRQDYKRRKNKMV